MHSRGENKRHCSKLIQGGWINTLRKRWQQAISLNAAGTPRWREIKQVFVRTEPSLLTLPGRISGISCSLFSNKRGWQQSAAVFAYAQTLIPGHLQDPCYFQSPAWRGRSAGTRGHPRHALRKLPARLKKATCSAPATCPECRSESSAELETPGGESRGWHRTWSKARFKLSCSPRTRTGRCSKRPWLGWVGRTATLPNRC